MRHMQGILVRMLEVMLGRMDVHVRVRSSRVLGGWIEGGGQMFSSGATVWARVVVCTCLLHTI